MEHSGNSKMCNMFYVLIKPQCTKITTITDGHRNSAKMSKGTSMNQDLSFELITKYLIPSVQKFKS